MKPVKTRVALETQNTDSWGWTSEFSVDTVMRKWCGPARPGLTGHTGKIIPSYSDGLLSTYQATIFPIPPTTCHNLLLSWSQEQRTHLVQRQAEIMRHVVRLAHPSRKGIPAKGCAQLTSSWLTSAFQLKKTYLMPLPPSYCSPE